MPEDSTTPDLVERTRLMFDAADRADWDAVLRFVALGGRLGGEPVGTAPHQLRWSCSYESLPGRVDWSLRGLGA
jgi:hypothetical protein